TRSNSSSSYWRIGLRTLMLGVQTTMSRPLRVCATLSRVATTPGASRMSRAPALARVPMPAATRRAASSLASGTRTVAPRCAAPTAPASPIPDPPPMIAAVFSERSKSLLRLIGANPCQEHDDEAAASGDDADDRGRQSGDAAAIGRELHRQHRRDAGG